MSVPDEVESLIADAPESAHIATAVDDRPHVAPVWYGYRDGTLYCLTGGRKLANVRRNPRVAVSIEEASGGDVAWSVTLFGTATVSDDPERMDWAAGWIYDRYDGQSSDDEADSEGTDDDQWDVEPGGGTDDAGDAGGSRADGEGSTATGEGYALVEIGIGSVSWNVYE